MHGFEKEGIRVTPDGFLSPAPHPEALGSSLTHPYITTDFTEPQLELRTLPSEHISHSLNFLRDVHIFTAKALENELLWPFSMPPVLPERQEQIPLACYGNSAPARKKTIYRRGIGLRYGRRRLTISGVHYNFSLDPLWLKQFFPELEVFHTPSSVNDCYFHIIRNLYRRIFYLTYLFGASPAFDKSFKPSGISRFKKHGTSTFYDEFATSLRAGDIGYTSAVQDRLPMSYDSLTAYAKDLGHAVSTCNPDYIKFSDKEDHQLTPNYLQGECELYTPFRPKQEMNSGESLLDALKKRGVGRLEIRLPDIDPACPEGIDPFTMKFLHLVVLDCLTNKSPALSPAEKKEIHPAHQEVIMNGRQKGLRIPLNGKTVLFHEAGKAYCESLYKLAEKMDRENASALFCNSLSRQNAKWDAPETTPSGRHLSNLLDNNKEFIEHGLETAEKNARFHKTWQPDPAFQKEIQLQTRISNTRLSEIEARDK